jgi:putative oxidoreductase
MRKWTTDVTALVLRVAAGLIFFPHGWSKVTGEGVAAYAELVGAALLIVGLLTRLDALLLAGTMFVATFIVQLPDALFEVPPGSIKLFVALHGIELPLAMLAMCVSLTMMGGGKYSLDALIAGLRRRSVPVSDTATV